MASLRFTDVQTRPMEFLDFTSLTLAEFQQLVELLEAAFQAHLAAWRLDGNPRTARRFAVYKNCPLPTPEDRLFGLDHCVGHVWPRRVVSEPSNTSVPRCILYAS